MADNDSYRLAPCGCLVRAWDPSRIVKACVHHQIAIDEDSKKGS